MQEFADFGSEEGQEPFDCFGGPEELVEKLAFFPHAIPVLTECEHGPEADQFPAHL
jgi:hypothetical protein